MLDKEVLHLWIAVADNARIGEQGHIARAGVFNGLGNGEQIEIVHGKGAVEDEARAIVEAQGDRGVGGQGGVVAFDGPDRLAVGQGDAGSGGRGPTLFDEIGVGQTRGLEQGDDGGFGVDRFAILLELKIIDAGAGQVDRALEVGGGNGDAVGRGNGGFAVDEDLRRAARCGRRCSGPIGIGGGNGKLFGLGLLLGSDFSLALRLFQLRTGNEKLPAEQHDHAEHDGKDHIAIVRIHGLGFRWPRPGDLRLSLGFVSCTRAMRPPRSATSLVKGWLMASRRASRT